MVPEADSRAEAQQVAFEWMRAVLQKDISLDALRRDVGDISDLGALLQRLYEGRLSDRNRSMTVLADRHGLSSSTVCRFLGIDKETRRRYLRTFKTGGEATLFARQTKSTRKFDDEAIKQAVAGGLGLSILSRHTLHRDPAQEDDVVILPVAGFPLHTSWQLVYLRQKRLSRAAQAFLALLEEWIPAYTASKGMEAG